jgi:ATP-dependent DNA ligase
MAARRAAKAEAGLADLVVPVSTDPMEARLVEALPQEEGWQFEPKWDGFRCLSFRSGEEVELRAKSGKSLTRYFPEVAAALRALPATRFVVDGELTIPRGETLDFDALQMRLHPAETRIKKLARETPAVLILFDLLLSPQGDCLMGAPLSRRRQALEAFFAALPQGSLFRLSPFTASLREARQWLDAAGGALDGVVAKRRDGQYRPGERAMLKVKRQRTADCVVGGFRYLSKTRKVGSLLLGLYDDAGKLSHVGFTATIANDERDALTRRLEKLVAPPGFTGNAPGGPSRWSSSGRSAEWRPVRPELIVEVRYDQVTGERFRHGTRLMRFRPDKAPQQCRMEQLRREVRPRKLLSEVMER